MDTKEQSPPPGSAPSGPRQKTCERCGSEFECRRHDVDTCECALVVIQPWQREWLGREFGDCVCSDCLREVAELPPSAADRPL